MKRSFPMAIAIFLPLFFCTPAVAQHKGPYAGLFLGGNMLSDAKGSDNLGNFGLDFDPGFLGSAVVGWDFEPGNIVGEGRIELEYTHRKNPLDQARFVEGSAKGGGNMTADSLMINFFGVFHDNRSWSPYLGAGLGAARLENSNLTVTGQPFSSDSAFVFAYQFGAGFDFALTKRLSLDLGYRFFSSTRPRLDEASGESFKMDYLNHSVVLGMRVGF